MITCLDEALCWGLRGTRGEEVLRRVQRLDKPKLKTIAVLDSCVLILLVSQGQDYWGCRDIGRGEAYREGQVLGHARGVRD